MLPEEEHRRGSRQSSFNLTECDNIELCVQISAILLLYCSFCDASVIFPSVLFHILQKK